MSFTHLPKQVNVLCLFVCLMTYSMPETVEHQMVGKTMTTNWKHVERNGHGLIEGTTLIFCMEGLRNTMKHHRLCELYFYSCAYCSVLKMSAWYWAFSASQAELLRPSVSNILIYNVTAAELSSAQSVYAEKLHMKRELSSGSCRKWFPNSLNSNSFS